MRSTQKINVSLQLRDLQVLAFLWKWKLVSNAALTSKRLFPNVSPMRAYNRLIDLRRTGYIQSRSEESGERHAWALTKKGFKAVRKHLPQLREEGFGAEHFYHDLMVTALHLGNWLVDRPASVSFVTEQELRRCDVDALPSWVPDTSIHRPDGYWGFAEGDQTKAIAIEVELNRKHLSTYEAVGDYYAEQDRIYRVLWMVESLTNVRSIQKKISESSSTRDKIHNFILEKDFLEHGWQSSIVHGPESNQTVDVFLKRLGREKPVIRPCNVTDRLLLEPRKSNNRSAAYKKSYTAQDSQLPPHIDA